MDVLKDEFDRDFEHLNPITRVRTRIARDERVHETLLDAFIEKADVALTAFRDEAGAQKFERRANISIVKDQIYNQYVDRTEVSKREAIKKLQSAMRITLSESGEEFAKLEEAAHEREQRWNGLLAEGKMSEERHKKRVKDLYKDADKFYKKSKKSVHAHIDEIVNAFIDHVQTFTPKDKETFEDVKVIDVTPPKKEKKKGKK